MNYYPIVIPTLCRFEHFKRCIESLLKNTHVEKTELIVGLDYPAKEEHWDGYTKITNYISNINGFKKITVLKRESNYGANANSTDLANYASSKYEAYIFTEDDNEFSPCFLDFMNKALTIYKDEPQITSVCGYTAFDYENIKKKGVIFTHDNCGWGMGVWRNKDVDINNMEFHRQIWNSTCKYWTLYLKAPAIASMLAAMIQKQALWGDVMRTVKNIKNETFQVRPYTSMVRNWGYDGTGLHCTVIDEKMEKQKILENTTFKLCPEEEIKNSLPFFTEFYFQYSHNRFKALYSIFRTALSIIRIRLQLSTKTTK